VSQVQPQSLKNISRIGIALSTKNSVVSKNGYLTCHLTQENFHIVVLHLWHLMMERVSTKEKSSTLSVATCQSGERTQ